MKKFLAIFITLVLLSNLFAFSVFAEETNKIVDITSVYSNAAGTEYEVGEDIVITGTTSVTGRDLVLRIYNDTNSLVFTDVIPAVDNKEKKFEFKGFKLPAVDANKEEGTYSYIVVVSTPAEAGENGGSVIDQEKMTVKIGKKTGGYTGGGSFSSSDISVIVVPWNEPEEEKETEETTQINEKTGEVLKKATEDTISEEAVKAAGEQKTAVGGAKFIEDTTKATAPEAMAWESTRNTIAVSVETMMANISSKRIITSSSTNTLVLKADSVSDSDLKKYTDTEKTLNAALDKNKITLNRNLIKEYIVNTTFSTAKKATVAVYKGFVEKLEKVGIETLTINDAKFRVSYSLVELKKMIGEKEFTSFDIDTTAMSGSSKKLAVSFDTDKT
ncbi:MAG: hypothetical protein IJ949_01935, partial [Oscillospiraceae bacterium]|nr:hypothetical protein [Oscillospiraceae bacterium]